MVDVDFKTGKFIGVKFSECEDDIIRQNYGKLAYKEIKTILDLKGFEKTYGQIQFRTKKLGLTTKGKGSNCNFSYIQGKRKVFFDENFFEIPNLINSYWAGFIAADGSINTDRFALSIQISDKDYEHLNKFCCGIKFSGKISRYVRKNGIAMCNANFRSRKLISDLEKWFN